MDDYEGITGNESYRDDLTLMYFASIAPATGKLVSLEMTPLQIRKFRLNHASARDAEWLRHVIARESKPLGARAVARERNKLVLAWR